MRSGRGFSWGDVLEATLEGAGGAKGKYAFEERGTGAVLCHQNLGIEELDQIRKRIGIQTDTYLYQ